VLCDGRGKGAELFDLPRMDTRQYMKPYKYVYCVTKTSQESHFFDGLAKVWLETAAALLTAAAACYRSLVPCLVGAQQLALCSLTSCRFLWYASFPCLVLPRWAASCLASTS